MQGCMNHTCTDLIDIDQVYHHHHMTGDPNESEKESNVKLRITENAVLAYSGQ